MRVKRRFELSVFRATGDDESLVLVVDLTFDDAEKLAVAGGINVDELAGGEFSMDRLEFFLSEVQP